MYNGEGVDDTRRDILKATGGAVAASLGGLSGCSTPRNECSFPRDVEDLSRTADMAHEYNESDYSDKTVAMYELLTAYETEIEGWYDEAVKREAHDCPAELDGHAFIGEKHGYGDGMKTVLSQLKSEAYDAVALEFLAQNDPELAAFNAGDREADEMTEHYLTPTTTVDVTNVQGDVLYERELPMRWPRDRDTLNAIFAHCAETDTAVYGLEPRMTEPLYPQKEFDNTIAQEDLPHDSFLQRAEGMVDTMETYAADHDRVLGLSGYMHVQQDMHSPLAMLAYTRVSNRGMAGLKDILDDPTPEKPPNVDERYFDEPETFTYTGRIPEGTPVLTTSPAEQREAFRNLSNAQFILQAHADGEYPASADIDPAPLINTLQSIQTTYEQLETVTPTMTGSHFDFTVDLQPAGSEETYIP